MINFLPLCVRQTTTTSGDGALILGDAVAGHLKITDGRVIGEDTVLYYRIEWGTEWEVGVGTLHTDGSFTRMEALARPSGISEVGMAPTPLPAGAKVVSFVATPMHLVATGTSQSSPRYAQPLVDGSAVAVGAEAESYGMGGAAIGVGAVAEWDHAKMIGSGQALHSGALEHYVSAPVELWSIDQLRGAVVAPGTAGVLRMVSVVDGEVFAGSIDVLVRPASTSAAHYHARIEVTVTTTGVDAITTVISNTLGTVPGISLAMTGEDDRPGSVPLSITVTHPAGGTSWAASAHAVGHISRQG